MTKYIKTYSNLRVRIKYDKIFKHYNLSVQKKFICLWISTGFFVDISEKQKTGPHRFSPIILSYAHGGHKEVYNFGEMDFYKRSKKLCKEYLKAQREQNRNKQVLVDL